MTDRRHPSGRHVLGLVDCPRCGNADLPRTEPCAVCKDVGKVSVPVATQWILDQGKRQGT